MITRRNLLTSTPALVATVATPTAACALPIDRSEIESLFVQWQAVCSEYVRDGDEADNYARYKGLQDQILASHPTTAKEMAILFVVETDDGGSDFRDEFFARALALAKGGAA